MQPMQHAIYANAGLIGMLERTLREQVSNVLDCRGQPLCGQVTPLDQGAFRDLAATHRSQRLAGTSRGQQLP